MNSFKKILLDWSAFHFRNLPAPKGCMTCSSAIPCLWFSLHSHWCKSQIIPVKSVEPDLHSISERKIVLGLFFNHLSLFTEAVTTWKTRLEDILYWQSCKLVPIWWARGRMPLCWLLAITVQQHRKNSLLSACTYNIPKLKQKYGTSWIQTTFF